MNDMSHTAQSSAPSSLPVTAEETEQQGATQRAFSPLTLWASLAFAVFLGFSRLSYGLLLPAIHATFPDSYSVLGVIGSANLGGYLLGTLLLPVLAAVVPSRLWLNTGAIIVMSGAMIASAFSGTVIALAAWRGVVGLASAVVAIVTLTLTLNEIVSGERGLASGIIWAGGAAGLIASGVVAPAVIGAHAPLTWREVWVGMGLVGFPAAWGLHRSLRHVAHAGTPSASDRLGASLLALLRPNAMLLLPIAYFAFGVGYIIYFTFFIALITRQGVASAAVGLVWSLIGVAGGIGGVVWGRAFDRWPTGFTLVLALGGEALGASSAASGNLVMEACGALLVGLAFIGIPALFTGLLRATIAPAYFAAGLSGITAMLALGQTVGPLIGGAVVERFGLGVGTAVSCVPLLIGALLMMSFGAWQRMGSHQRR